MPHLPYERTKAQIIGSYLRAVIAIPLAIAGIIIAIFILYFTWGLVRLLIRALANSWFNF